VSSAFDQYSKPLSNTCLTLMQTIRCTTTYYFLLSKHECLGHGI